MSEPEAGPDLDDRVVGADLGEPDDPPDRVGVDDEVLPPLLGRADPQSGRQLTDLARAQQRARLGRFRHGGEPTEPSRCADEVGRVVQFCQLPVHTAAAVQG